MAYKAARQGFVGAGLLFVVACSRYDVAGVHAVVGAETGAASADSASVTTNATGADQGSSSGSGPAPTSAASGDTSGDTENDTEGALPLDASYVDQIVPTTVVVDQRYSATLRMRNDSDRRWTESGRVMLGFVAAGADSKLWGNGRVSASGDVEPGAIAIFEWTIRAPSVPGTYPFQWRMLETGGHGWFGEASESIEIEVVNPLPLDASFFGQSVPRTMTAGETYPVQVQMRNRGALPWLVEGPIKLGFVGDADGQLWGRGRVTPIADVLGGRIGTFSWDAVAPETPGTYRFEWRMTEMGGAGWFGLPSSAFDIEVLAP